LIGDVDQGIDPARADTPRITEGAGGGRGEQVADLEDLDRPVGSGR
jgi:hypothetical protein